MLRTRTLVSAAFLAAAAGASSFLTAGPGAPLAFQPVPLPEVAFAPPADGSPVPGKLDRSPWAPSLDAVVNGELVVTTEAQMKSLWAKLFAAPYDPTLFDFSTSFVIVMGGGPLVLGSFDISTVEHVASDYASQFFPGGGSDSFLSVTSTLFLPGVQPADPPPPTYRVSAVRVAKEHFGDVVFHRSVLLGV